MGKLYRLDVDEVLSNISLFTNYDIGDEGQGLIVEEKNYYDAVCELANNFGKLIDYCFKPYNEMEEE